MLRQKLISLGLPENAINAINNVGIVNYEKEKHDEKENLCHKFTFKSRHSEEFDITNHLPSLIKVVAKKPVGMNPAGNFHQNPAHFDLAIYLEDNQSVFDEFIRILIFLHQYKLLDIFKTSIITANGNFFTENHIKDIVEVAQQNYAKIPTAGTFISTVDLFGIYPSLRATRVQSRFDMERSNWNSGIETLAALLRNDQPNEEKHGKGLKSFSYALTSAIIPCRDLKTDQEAVWLSKLTAAELSRRANRMELKPHNSLK